MPVPEIGPLKKTKEAVSSTHDLLLTGQNDHNYVQCATWHEIT